MKDKYLEQLKNEIIKAGFDEQYSNNCCNFASRLLDNNLPVIFDVEHLALLLGTSKEFIYQITFCEKYYYRTIQIPKKREGFRELDIPSMELKYIQTWILEHILNNIKVSENATGFKKESSIVNNASKHLKKDCLINIDIKDFFPSISFIKVFRIFVYYGYTKEVAYILAKLCTHNDRLPQGAPTSPAISNIVCIKLDTRLFKLAEKYHADYSRYADDISFSGSYGINKLIDISQAILAEEGFKINNKKTRIAYSHQRQEVTGIIVNNSKLRVDKKYKRKLWQEIYYCKKYGVLDHMNITGCTKSFFKEHIYGKAYYVNMVEPDEGKKLFQALAEIEWEY